MFLLSLLINLMALCLIKILISLKKNLLTPNFCYGTVHMYVHTVHVHVQKQYCGTMTKTVMPLYVPLKHGFMAECPETVKQ